MKNRGDRAHPSCFLRKRKTALLKEEPRYSSIKDGEYIRKRKRKITGRSER